MNTTETKTTHGALNGVDRDRLFATIEALQENPALGAFQFRAENHWIRGGHNRSTVQGFRGAGKEDDTRKAPFVLDNDEPDVLLGTDQGANPVEHVLHALAGCLTTSMVYHAAARGIRLEEVRSRLEGDLDVRGILGITDEVRNGYQDVRVTFQVRADVDDATLAELGAMAARYSPVFDIVTNPVPVQVDVQRA